MLSTFFLTNMRISSLIRFLYANDKFDDKKNHGILLSSINFVKGSQWFDGKLFYFLNTIFSQIIIIRILVNIKR